jgi:hypothetical protein
LDKQKTRSLLDVLDITSTGDSSKNSGPASSLVSTTRSAGGPILISSFGKELMELFSNRPFKNEIEFTTECKNNEFLLCNEYYNF